jgi:hypothetical protein
MASTYSDLKIELIGTGEQAGTWGSTTNINLGTALEEAIVGSANVSFSSADVTLTLADNNGSQTARHLRLNLTGTSGGARNLILGSGCQIDKPYIINNGLADAVTVKNTTGTGVTVDAGKSMFVYNNGTNVVEVLTQFNGNAATATTAATATALQTARTIQGVSFNGTANITVVTAGTGITVAGTAVSIPQAVGTTSSVQFGSFGVGTAASGTTGEIRATNNVTAFFSSDRKFKENIQDIESPLKKVIAIGGKTFDWTDEYVADHGGEDGYFVNKSDFGVIAQDVQDVFPVAVKTREDGALAVDYEKLCSLAFAAIKELEKRVAELEAK